MKLPSQWFKNITSLCKPRKLSANSPPPLIWRRGFKRKFTKKKKKKYSLQFFLSTQTKSAAYCRNIMKSRECPEQLQVAQSASGYSSSRSSSRNAGRSETPVLRSGQGENFFLFVFQFFFQLFQKLRRLEKTLPPSPAVWRLNTRWWHLLVISWSCWSYRPAAPLMLKQKKQRHSEMKFCLKI